MHFYDTCQDMRTHATILLTKGGSQEETGPGLSSLVGTFARPVDVEILGMWWAPRHLYATPTRVEHFGEHLDAAKAGRSNS